MVEILNIKDLQSDISRIRVILDKISARPLSGRAVKRLKSFVDNLRDDLVISIEYDYVDAVYRDVYYRFYATKLREYARNCAKISFFVPGVVNPAPSIDYSNWEDIKKTYLGFLVVRPIEACIGRNVISTQALKCPREDIDICRAEIESTAVGMKVIADGFPHSSQDGEMMTCAETTLWAIAEYYGHKYPGHTPTLPSEILEAMRPVSYQRQLPSRGLTFDQIMVGLKSFGFSPEVYNLYMRDPADPLHKRKVINPEMQEVLACYIESGFPIALCLQGKTGHAVVCVGKSSKYEPLVLVPVNGKDIFFSNRAVGRIVLNDDNFPPYELTSISRPLRYYHNPDWDDMTIAHFMVPLPAKVYKNAFVAIAQVRNLLGKVAENNIVARTFLASCRSYRSHIAQSGLLDNDTKNLLLNLPLPRFVWITELCQKAEFEGNVVSGLVVFDVTEPDEGEDLILLINTDGKALGYNDRTSRYENLLLPARFMIERFNNIH